MAFTEIPDENLCELFSFTYEFDAASCLNCVSGEGNQSLNSERTQIILHKKYFFCIFHFICPTESLLALETGS